MVIRHDIPLGGLGEFLKYGGSMTKLRNQLRILLLLMGKDLRNV